MSRNAGLAAMPDSQGRLPIHWCAEEANAPMLRILLGLGEERARGQLTHRDEKGKTAEEILSEAQVGDGTYGATILLASGLHSSQSASNIAAGRCASTGRRRRLRKARLRKRTRSQARPR